MPYLVVVGRGLANGVVELRDRRTGERAESPVADAVDRVANRLTAALRAADEV